MHGSNENPRVELTFLISFMISWGSREEVVFMLHVKRRLRGLTGSGSPFEATPRGAGDAAVGGLRHVTERSYEVTERSQGGGRGGGIVMESARDGTQRC